MEQNSVVVGAAVLSSGVARDNDRDSVSSGIGGKLVGDSQHYSVQVDNSSGEDTINTPTARSVHDNSNVDSDSGDSGGSGGSGNGVSAEHIVIASPDGQRRRTVQAQPYTGPVQEAIHSPTVQSPPRDHINSGAFVPLDNSGKQDLEGEQVGEGVDVGSGGGAQSVSVDVTGARSRMENFDGIEQRRRRRERRAEKLPIKTAIAAVLMFAFGTLFLFMGIRALPSDRDRGIAMIVIGSLTFIPGSYATYNLYGAWKGWRGYKYAHIPSYDD